METEEQVLDIPGAVDNRGGHADSKAVTVRNH